MKALRSTSFKLVSLFLLSCIAIVFIIQSASKLLTDYSEKRVALRNRSRIEFSQLLAQKLERSGDEMKEILSLNKDLGMDVRIEDLQGQKQFATPDATDGLAQVEKEADHFIWTPEAKTGEYRQVPFSVVTLHDRRYLFFFKSAPFQELQLQWLSPMTILIILILFGNFILIRWLFKPVAWLSDGVDRLGQGDFDVQVPCRAHDELGDLAISFNQTVEKVRQIVESKKQLLLDVSHELRTPLTRIRVALELDWPKAREHVRKNVLVLESMIHDLLESARLESSHRALRLENFDFREALASVSFSVQGLRPGVKIQEPAGDCHLQGDRQQVEVCLRNILDNALKYSSKQSLPVEVAVERPMDAGLRVSVRDFGVGIPEEERDLIFEPFYRVDKSRMQETGGYGLGLSLCQKIMTAHGGRISIQTPTSGGGSVFVLEFPRPDHGSNSETPH